MNIRQPYDINDITFSHVTGVVQLCRMGESSVVHWHTNSFYGCSCAIVSLHFMFCSGASCKCPSLHRLVESDCFVDKSMNEGKGSRVVKSDMRTLVCSAAFVERHVHME